MRVITILLVVLSFNSIMAQFKIESGNASLTVDKKGNKQYSLFIEANGGKILPVNYPFPITLEISGKTLTGYYSDIKTKNNGLECKAELKTEAGAILEIKDFYIPDIENFFRLERNVSIIKKGTYDEYFNSYFGLIFNKNTSLDDYEFFVPGIWYKGNKYMTQRSLAVDYSDNYFYFREDRLPLPVISTREKKTGFSAELIHIESYPQTFYGEIGLNRIVDDRMLFGSLGFVKTDNLSMQFVFPGIEGEKTYTGRLPGSSKVFSYRSHPVSPNTKHNYKLVFGFTQSNNFPELVETSWKRTWNKYNPPIHKMDVNDAYIESIKVLDAYLETINGATGWPFSIYLPNGNARAYNFQMGFIGFQLSNAYFLLRYGLENGIEDYINRASMVLDFWINDSMTEFGLPKTWTDAYVDRKNTWRDYQTYMRSMAGGMEGLMAAWSIMKKHEIDKPEWLNYCKTFANWLVNNQENDGSFFIRYRWETGKPDHDSKYTTTNIIRFLIEIYKATNDERYINTAIKAGDFSYDFIHNDYLYVGGVIDNPNVKDRESGQMAIYAFLALYDATKNEKWKEAVIQAGRYTETFMFAYDVPMAINDSLTDFPKHRDITGQTLIATGHSGIDNGLSFSSFQYYRLYLLTGDKHFLHVAKVIQNNTLQLMDLDGKMGYKYRGLVTECFNPQSNRGHSVRQQLPWNQAAVLEPIHRFMDAFGEWDIDIIENIPLEKRIEMIENYAKTQGMYIENNLLK